MYRAKVLDKKYFEKYKNTDLVKYENVKKETSLQRFNCIRNFKRRFVLNFQESNKYSLCVFIFIVDQ